jgi:hypothetical protein
MTRRYLTIAAPTVGRTSEASLSSVTVAVDELHTAAVTGILNQYGPLEIKERSDSARI